MKKEIINMYNNFSLRTKIVIKKTFNNLSIEEKILIMSDAKKNKYI